MGREGEVLSQLIPGFEKEHPDIHVEVQQIPWTAAHEKLLTAFEKLRPEEWLERHDAVSAEDFANEPLRNRLAVLLSRAQHTSLHEGQMRLAKSR